MKKLLLICLLLFVSFLTFDIAHVCAQLPTLEWVRSYPDSTFPIGAIGYSLALDSGGNVYVTGAHTSPSTYEYCTIKYSPSGDPLWLNNFTGSGLGGRQAYAIAVDRYSNAYVSGYSYNPATNFDYCTVKYDSNGVQRWVQYYDGPSHGIDQVQKIAIDKAGNIYVTGFSSEGGMLDFRIATVKYSPQGRQLWAKRYGTNDASTYANGMLIDDSCNIYITGANNYRAVTLKYDSSGVLKWTQVYEGGFGAQANALALDNNNNVCVTGFSWGVIGQHVDYFTAKYSISGTIQWVNVFNTDTNAVGSRYNANSIGVDHNGSVYVSGDYLSDQNAHTWLCTIKYSESGDLLWVIKDSSFDVVGYVNLVMDKDDAIYIGCATGSYSILKYNTSGNIIWKETHNGGMPFDILVDKNYNLFQTGEGVGGMVTVKYSQPIAIKTISFNIPESFKLYQNYPNPFNPSTKIKFNVPYTGSVPRTVRLSIYDALGRKVAALVNESLKPGEYEAEWNASNFASGVYFYRLEAGNFIETKKMTLIK